MAVCGSEKQSTEVIISLFLTSHILISFTVGNMLSHSVKHYISNNFINLEVMWDLRFSQHQRPRLEP
jgi:hypothetical protein